MGFLNHSKIFHYCIWHIGHFNRENLFGHGSQVSRHLVHLLQTLVASLQSLHNLHLNLSELDGLHHLLEVVQLGIGLV